MDERPPGTPAPDAPPPYLGGTAPGGGQMSERMQSLLSRAVEDQMAEQRQLQTLVNDIRTSLAQLQEEVRQGAGAHTLEQVRGEVTGLGAELRSSTTLLGERLEAVVRAVTASAQAAQAVGAQMQGMQEQLGAHQQAIAALPAAVQHAAAEAGPGDTAVRDEMAALRAEMAQLRAATGELVRTEVAGLRTGLQAEVAALRAAGTSNADEAVRRVSAHVDTAVFALAEALLRPRGAAPALPPVAAPTRAVAPPVVAPAAAPAVGVTTAAAPRLASPPAASTQAPAEADDEIETDDVEDPSDETEAEMIDGTVDGVTSEPADDDGNDDDDEAPVAQAVAGDDLAHGADVGSPAEIADGDDDDDAASSVPAVAPAADAVDGDGEVPLSWADADRPQGSLRMGRGWDSTPAPDTADDAAAEPTESDDSDDSDDPADRERRRPWWRPGG